MRDLTLNRWIDVCRSKEVAELQMKSLSGPVDNINQAKSSSKKSRAPTPVDGRSAKKISCKFCSLCTDVPSSLRKKSGEGTSVHRLQILWL